MRIHSAASLASLPSNPGAVDSASWSTRVLDSLSGISDADLDRVTRDATVFLDRRWLRLLESVNVSELVRGEIALRYATVSVGGALVALCPFIVTRSPSIYSHYSLEKFFFTSWQEDLKRMNPGSESWVRWVALAVDGYRRLARLLRTGVEGLVAAMSPVTYRSGIACSDMPPGDRQRAHELILGTLQEVSRAENLPLCFYSVQEDQAEMRETLVRGGFSEIFRMYDNRIDIGFQTFEQYLGQFSGKARRNHTYEIRNAARDGFRFERVPCFGQMSAEFEAFYEATYSKYGEEHFLQPASFWREVERHMGTQAEAIVAYHGAKPVGFSMLFHKGEDLWVYRVGRGPDMSGEEAPVYFGMIFYEPVKRALELGCKRIWCGSGAWEVKRRRGARGVALYDYFWFPTARSRGLLLPYLSLFARLSQQEMSKVVKVAGGDRSTEGAAKV
ncbi:GNAT family N-acetyltransferase [Archangium sp.]|uniref:GNAT family N-acetyltransferase n=1 Tax=Archangium sp. TaxID=1872627 RepID=UPI002D4F5C43|nr:GNAT family N-acetyltransferase [Archangium sp.]HYO56007.1 GNAT family N-acetyltransferase [Archangium sp.]